MDCFNGSGTTGVASLLLNCKYIGIDISSNYLDMSVNRLNNYTKYLDKAINEFEKHKVKCPYKKDEMQRVNLWQ